MADVTSVALGGVGGTVVIGSLIQLYRMFREDKHNEKLHTQANNFATSLIDRITSLEKENSKLHKENLTLAQEVGELRGAVTALRAQLKSSGEEFHKLFAELKTKHQGLLLENTELRIKLATVAAKKPDISITVDKPNQVDATNKDKPKVQEKELPKRSPEKPWQPGG